MSQFIQLGTSVFTPVSIANGGTGATSFSTTDGIVKYDGTKLVTSTTALIDSANIVTNTAQPSFRVYLAASTANNVTGDGTVYKIVFDTAEFDQASNFNTGTGTFTAPKAGKYLFGCTVGITNLGAGHVSMDISVTTTSNSYILNLSNPFNASVSTATNQTASILVPMALNDSAIVTVTISGSTKTVGVVGGIDNSCFWGQLVC